MVAILFHDDGPLCPIYIPNKKCIHESARSLLYGNKNIQFFFLCFF